MNLKAFFLVLMLAGAAVQAQDTTYYFVPNDGGSSISASTTLDAPFSPNAWDDPPYGNGSYNDVVSFSLSDPVRTYTKQDLTGGLSLSSPFTWNPAEIVQMGFFAVTFVPPNNFSDVDVLTYENGVLSVEHVIDIYEDVPLYSETGSWQAAPDAGSTALLLGMALTGLATYRRFRKYSHAGIDTELARSRH